MIHFSKHWLIAVAGLLLIALPLPVVLPLSVVRAAAPSTLKVTKQLTLPVAPAAAWDQIKNFDGLHTWHPGFSGAEIVKGSNNQPGAVRKLTLKGGPSFTEELLSYDGTKHTMRYRIIESPLPIDDYVSTIEVKSGGKKGTSVVSWEGTFKRKNLTPKPDETDEAVTKLISGVYDAGLDNLKKKVEAK
jgi:mxaD protein